MEDDYSSLIKDIARRFNATGSRIHRLGSLTRGVLTSVSPPTVPKRPDVTPPDSDDHLVKIDGYYVAHWIAQIVLWARKDGWPGQVTSGYRTDADQREACRHVCGNPNGCPGRCAKPGTSNHRFKTYPGGAVDVSDYQDFGRRVKRYPHGQTIKNDLPQDPVHFSLSGH